MKSTTWATLRQSAAAAPFKLHKNSSEVGLSPSTMSVTAFIKTVGIDKIAATYAIAAPCK